LGRKPVLPRPRRTSLISLKQQFTAHIFLYKSIRHPRYLAFDVPMVSE
jgi:hypothetical protein